LGPKALFWESTGHFRSPHFEAKRIFAERLRNSTTVAGIPACHFGSREFQETIRQHSSPDF
jgi:hypothetical protein